MLAVVGAVLIVAACVGPVARPVADFTACPDGSRGALDYVFTSTAATAAGQPLVRAVWEFGDGSPSAQGLGPMVHLFPAPGTYAVTLTVTDRHGVSGTVTQFVDVVRAAFVDPTWSLTLGDPPAVTGTVGNGSDVVLREVVVRVRFCDPDGVRLDDVRCAIPDMAPRERVRFDVEATQFIARVYYASVEIESFSAECAPSDPVHRRGEGSASSPTSRRTGD